MEDKILEYYEAYGYPNLEKLYKLMKADNVSIKKNDIKAFLSKQEEKQILNQQTVKKKDLGHIVAFGVNEEWQMDTFFLQRYWKENHGYKYILAVVDIFSRKAYCIAMKTKDSNDVIDALTTIVKMAGDKPHVISTDNDTAYTGLDFQAFCKTHDILHQTNVKNDHYALGIIDRFARTTKMMFSTMYLRNKNKNWVDNLDKNINIYNNMPHGGILDYKPNDVIKSDDIKSIIAHYNAIKNKKNNTISDIKIGDKVRIYIKGKFDKGTDPLFSDEVYIVTDVNGKKIKLNNGEVKKRSSLLIVPSNTVSSGKNIIKDAKEKRKTEVALQAEGIDETNIIDNKIKIVKPKIIKKVKKDYSYLIGQEFYDEGIKFKIVDVFYSGGWKVNYISMDKKKDEHSSTLTEVEEWLKNINKITKDKDKSDIVQSNVLSGKRNRTNVTFV